MKIDKIFIDMDGVLADFDRGVKELLNLEPLNQEENHPELTEQLFQAIQSYPDFYWNLKPIEGAIELLNDLKEKYTIEILTGIPKPERGIVEAKDNKVKWIEKYFGKEIPVNAVLRKDKRNFVENNRCVLIDDFTENIEQWEKAGGIGILFKSANQVYEELERIEQM